MKGVECYVWKVCHVEGGREPPDAMSLHYADTSLPDLLGRSSLNYADQAPAMQTVPLLCSKWASTLQHSFFKILVLMYNKKFKQFFFDIVS